MLGKETISQILILYNSRGTSNCQMSIWNLSEWEALNTQMENTVPYGGVGFKDTFKADFSPEHRTGTWLSMTQSVPLLYVI